MALWRFVSEEEDQLLREEVPVPRVEGAVPSLNDIGIYEVVEGSVSPYFGGMTLDVAHIVRPGWYALLLGEELPGHTYNGWGLKVLMYGGVVELKNNTLITLFPPEHLEKARELTALTPD